MHPRLLEFGRRDEPLERDRRFDRPDRVGARLARLAKDTQVLVVTHSPQVAARAAHHWHVIKDESDDGARTRVVELDETARQEEIARMLAGAKVTPEARAAAGSLIDAAQP